MRPTILYPQAQINHFSDYMFYFMVANFFPLSSNENLILCLSVAYTLFRFISIRLDTFI
jgi:hypothetical protein